MRPVLSASAFGRIGRPRAWRSSGTWGGILIDQGVDILPKPPTCYAWRAGEGGHDSVDACRRAHRDASELVPMFAMLKDVTDGATVGAAQRLHAEGFTDSMIDLGSALNIALSSGEGFPEAIVEGSAALSSAENSTWVTNLWARVRETAREIGVEL